MIFRNKLTGVVVQNAVGLSDIQGEHFRFANNNPVTLRERLYTEEEHQAGIEAAVKEHDVQYGEVLQGITDAESHTVLGKIHELWSSYTELKLENHSLKDVNETLNDRIAELETERQPVEVSTAISKAIELYKKYPHINWEADFITRELDGYFEPQLSTLENEELHELSAYDRLLIIQRGYTVKIDPLTKKINDILNNYHIADDHKESLLTDLSAYVRDNYEAK